MGNASAETEPPNWKGLGGSHPPQAHALRLPAPAFCPRSATNTHRSQRNATLISSEDPPQVTSKPDSVRPECPPSSKTLRSMPTASHICVSLTTTQGQVLGPFLGSQSLSQPPLFSQRFTQGSDPGHLPFLPRMFDAHRFLCILSPAQFLPAPSFWQVLPWLDLSGLVPGQGLRLVCPSVSRANHKVW